jgi:hypothetical protein
MRQTVVPIADRLNSAVKRTDLEIVDQALEVALSFMEASASAAQLDQMRGALFLLRCEIATRRPARMPFRRRCATISAVNPSASRAIS